MACLNPKPSSLVLYVPLPIFPQHVKELKECTCQSSQLLQLKIHKSMEDNVVLKLALEEELLLVLTPKAITLTPMRCFTEQWLLRLDLNPGTLSQAIVLSLLLTLINWIYIRTLPTNALLPITTLSKQRLFYCTLQTPNEVSFENMHQKSAFLLCNSAIIL